VTEDRIREILKEIPMNTNKPEIWQNSNGTWSHRLNAKCERDDKIGCLTDMRFHKEWLSAAS
jgi:hypothetical protein